MARVCVRVARVYVWRECVARTYRADEHPEHDILETLIKNGTQLEYIYTYSDGDHALFNQSSLQKNQSRPKLERV